MNRYRKRPVVIEAVQWDGTAESAEPIVNLILSTGGTARYRWDDPGPPTIAIDTLEGTMLANAGDYIIRGVRDEFYPCKSEIFEATYDAVADAPGDLG